MGTNCETLSLIDRATIQYHRDRLEDAVANYAAMYPVGLYPVAIEVIEVPVGDEMQWWCRSILPGKTEWDMAIPVYSMRRL